MDGVCDVCVSITRPQIFGEAAGDAVARRQRALQEKFKASDALIGKYEHELEQFQKSSQTGLKPDATITTTKKV